MRLHFFGTGCALAAMAAIPALGQTRVDLRTQTRNVDFSGAASTKPSKTGTLLPAACSIGETFLKTDAQPGQNLYACTAANTWTVQGSSAAGNYSTTFTAATTITVPGATHKLGTANLLVEVYDNETPAWWVEPDYVLINPATYDVTVSFARPQSGLLVINAGGGSSNASTGGAGLSAQLADFQVTRTSSTTLAVGPNCTPTTPCNVRIGGVVYPITTGATVTLASGTGLAYFYMDPAGNLTVGHNLTLTCSAGCTAVSGITAFPVNAIPLYTWSATANSWDLSGVDRRAFLSSKSLAAGTGIVTIDAGPQTLVAVDSATVPTYYTASATLSFPSIPNGACGNELTLALPGASAGDPVAPGWPPTLSAGFFGLMRVSAANTVAVRLCNFSGVTTAPPTDTFRATIVRSF